MPLDATPEELGRARYAYNGARAYAEGYGPPFGPARNQEAGWEDAPDYLKMYWVEAVRAVPAYFIDLVAPKEADKVSVGIEMTKRHFTHLCSVATKYSITLSKAMERILNGEEEPLYGP